MLGTSKLKSWDPLKVFSIPVKDIIVHPKYWGRTFIMGDVALLRLHTPAIFSKYVQPICLPEPSYNLKVGTQCWVTGWGQIKQRYSGEQDRIGGGVRCHRGCSSFLQGSCLLDPLMVPLRKLVAITSVPWFFGCGRTAPHVGGAVMIYTIVLAVGSSFRPSSARAGHDHLPLTEAQSQGFINSLTRSFVHLTNFERLPHAKPLALGIHALPAEDS